MGRYEVDYFDLDEFWGIILRRDGAYPGVAERVALHDKAE